MQNNRPALHTSSVATVMCLACCTSPYVFGLQFLVLRKLFAPALPYQVVSAVCCCPIYYIQDIPWAYDIYPLLPCLGSMGAFLRKACACRAAFEDKLPVFEGTYTVSGWTGQMWGSTTTPSVGWVTTQNCHADVAFPTLLSSIFKVAVSANLKLP